jgi:hypothetical protein
VKPVGSLRPDVLLHLEITVGGSDVDLRRKHLLGILAPSSSKINMKED